MMNKSLIIVKERAPKTQLDERGMALLLTLLVTIILSVVVLEFNYLMRVRATLSGHLVDDLKARTVADAGVQTAKAVLLNDVLADSESDSMVDALDEDWALEIELETQTSETKAYISDEMSKLNLNRLVERAENELDIESTNAKIVENVRRLFESLMLDPNLVDAIVDWIDENDEEQPFGAESSYYESLDSPVRCKNGPLDSVEELLLMEGFDKEILYGSEDVPGLAEFVTVCGEQGGRVNINTAPEEVIAAVLNNESVASAIVGMREEAPFEGAADMAARFPDAKLSEKFTTQSSFFMVSSNGRIFSGSPGAGEAPIREVQIKTLIKRVSGAEEDQDDYFSIDTVSWKVNR